jgi:hypothetical protein
MIHKYLAKEVQIMSFYKIALDIINRIRLHVNLGFIWVSCVLGEHYLGLATRGESSPIPRRRTTGDLVEVDVPVVDE